MQEFALVQHSAFGFANDPDFARGLQTEPVTPAEAKRVRAVGGVVGDYVELEDLAMRLMYPDADGGLVPRFRGEFHQMKVGGLQVAVPLREIVA